MAEMKVTGQTSIQELQRFASGAGTDKILGRDNGDGTITLYISAKGAGAGFKEYFVQLDGRRRAARDAVDLVLQRVDNRMMIMKRSVVAFDAPRENRAIGDMPAQEVSRTASRGEEFDGNGD